jgi:hypothetical protein
MARATTSDCIAFYFLPQRNNAERVAELRDVHTTLAASPHYLGAKFCKTLGSETRRWTKKRL